MNKILILNNVGVAAHSDPLKQNGITLIALIITIIVMLILVGVTINVALNGGLFSKAEKAAYQTNVSTIKEQVEIERAIKIAENNGEIPTNYGITISSLSISDALKTEFGTKLVISNNAELYYDATVVTKTEEQTWLKELGITEYEEPEEDLPPTFTAKQINQGQYTDYAIIELDVTFQNEEQAYKALEYAILEETGVATIEEFFLAQYNANAETPVEKFEDIGMTVEECMEQMIASIASTTTNKEDFNDKVIVCLDAFNGITYSVKRPDSSVYTSEEITLEQYLEEGIGGLKRDVWFYAAPQTGEYEITLTIGEYVLTDTVTVESI